MKKIILICLLLSFLSLPWVNGIHLPCQNDDKTSLCQIAETHDDQHTQAGHHCGCSPVLLFSEKLKIIYGPTKPKETKLSLAQNLFISEIPTDLYRPPIV